MIKIYEKDGYNLSNKVKNGNFINTSYWTGVSSVSDGVAISQDMQQNIAFIDHKYYISFYVKSLTDGDLLVIRTNNQSLKDYVITGEWEKITYITPTLSNSDTLLRFFTEGISADFEIKEVMVIDLNAAGLENKSVAELESIITHYIDGTKFILPILHSIDRVINAKIRDALSGEYTFEFTTLFNRIENCQVNCIVEFDNDYFKVTRVSKDLSSGFMMCTVNCEHISYLLNEYVYDSGTAYADTPINIITDILQGTNLTVGTVYFSGSVTLNIEAGANRRLALMNLIALIGGEIEYDGYTINVIEHRGSETTKILTDKKNIINVNATEENDIKSFEIAFYKMFDIEVGDEVNITFTPFNINEDTRIISIEYNPFFKYNAVIEIGDYIPEILDNISNISDNLTVLKQDFIIANGEFTSRISEVEGDIVTMGSEISQTTGKIELVVGTNKLVGDDGVISAAQIALAINAEGSTAVISADHISLTGKTIGLTSDNIIISSTNFNVDKFGNITAANAKLTSADISGKITASSGAITGKLTFGVSGTSYISGNDSYRMLFYDGSNYSSAIDNNGYIYVSNLILATGTTSGFTERVSLRYFEGSDPAVYFTSNPKLKIASNAGMSIDSVLPLYIGTSGFANSHIEIGIADYSNIYLYGNVYVNGVQI